MHRPGAVEERQARGLTPNALSRDGFLISGWLATHPEMRKPSRNGGAWTRCGDSRCGDST
ncbi:hypothetical protein ACFPRL_16605 [Pseudoclavibacter helvolus]